MAEAKDIIGKGLSGQIGKQIVFKRYANKTVVTKYPDMTNIKPSAAQIAKRIRFAAAVQYARNINNNPELKATYINKIPKGSSVYHFALSEYLKKMN
jgi:hemoglobin-like flavoprotein